MTRLLRAELAPEDLCLLLASATLIVGEVAILGAQLPRDLCWDLMRIQRELVAATERLRHLGIPSS